MPGGSDLSISLHLLRGWLIVPVRVGARYTLEMVLDTGAPLSGISQGTANLLLPTGFLEPMQRRGNVYLLKQLSIQGQPIDDLEVRVLQRLTEVRAPGILGLDFLGRFEEIHCHVPSLTLTLTDP